MPPFLFRCPTTGNMVQAIHADEDEADRADRPHLVNPRTGKVLGYADD